MTVPDDMEFLRLIIVRFFDEVVHDRPDDQKSDGVADEHPQKIELHVTPALVEERHPDHDPEQTKRYDQGDEDFLFVAFFLIVTQFRYPSPSFFRGI